MTDQPSVTGGILEASLIPQSSAPTGSQVELIESDLIPDSSGIGSRTLDESFGRALGKTDVSSAHVSSAHRESKIKLPYVALRHSLASVDAILIVLASMIGGAAYQSFANGNLGNSEPLLGVGVASALLYVLIGGVTEFYDLRSVFSRRWDFGRVFAYWSLVILLLALLAFLMKIGPVF